MSGLLYHCSVTETLRISDNRGRDVLLLVGIIGLWTVSGSWVEYEGIKTGMIDGGQWTGDDGMRKQFAQTDRASDMSEHIPDLTGRS